MTSLKLVEQAKEDHRVFKFATKPLLKFKLEYKSPHWIIYIHSEYNNNKLDDRKWIAITDNTKHLFEDEFGNSNTYYKVRFFETQSSAYDYIRDTFDPESIEEYVPPPPGILIRFGNWLFGSKNL